MRLTWENDTPTHNGPVFKLIAVHGWTRRHVATVWSNGVWHTWDRCGIGGENASCPSVRDAKSMALASAVEQGFVPGVEFYRQRAESEKASGEGSDG